MFVPALTRSLNFDVQSIYNEIMPFELRTAPAFNPTRAKRWNQHTMKYYELTKQPDLDRFVHFLTDGLPGRLPLANDRRDCRPGLPLFNQKSSEDILKDGVEYCLVGGVGDKVQDFAGAEPAMPDPEPIEIRRVGFNGSTVDGDEQMKVTHAVHGKRQRCLLRASKNGDRSKGILAYGSSSAKSCPLRRRGPFSHLILCY